MNSRERILAVLSGRHPDRIPWIPLVYRTYFPSLPDFRRRFAGRWDDWDDGPAVRGEEDALEELAYRVKFYREIGADYMDWGATAPWDVAYEDVTTWTERRGESAFQHYRTPLGTLVQEQRFTARAHAVFPVTSLVRTPEDYVPYAFLITHTRQSPRPGKLQRYLDVIGDAGAAFVAAPAAAIKQWLLDEIQLGDLVYALADHPREMEELEARMHDLGVERCRLLAASPAQVFIDFAVTGTGMLSPRLFREHCLSYARQCADIFHAQGKRYLNHVSGEPLRVILPLVAQSGVDGLYGLSLPAFGHGDADLAEIRAALGPKVVLVAGIEPHLLATGTVEQVKDATRYTLAECATAGGPVVLGTTDDTPYGSPPRNLAAVSEVVEASGYGL